MIPSPRSSRGNKTNDNEVIVLDDSDSDTPVPKLSQVTKSTKASASEAVRPAPVTVPSTGGSNAITNKPKGVKSTSRPSKLVHPLAREEEESSDSAQKPSLPVIVDPPPARPRKKVARRTKTVANVMATSSNITKGEVETKREEFRRRATESEKQRRDEHRRRQQEFIKAKSEERENLEQITHDVDELKLSTGQQVQNLRQDTSQPSLTPLDEIIVQTGVPRDTSPPIIITTSQRADKELEKEQELNLLPQWIHAQDNGPDIWDRASAKKAASVPPSASRRKVKAQKLGDARPPVWNFNITQWMKTMKGSPLQ
ncbi:hypothetical protein AN958_04644 [Leucoagaricus sp. SymC.cos]|nr:hypothetical protein AN958_04644 [Leucoagaricus sp. SymC.cos]